ncbi:DNA sulfur modification protein DndB [Blastomonas sp.]|uniref:DNA sulfur modification protein DndB n=1 Tax=Blastomonas sp. TaxID=1909299 RepID=UPI00406A8F37
MDSPYEYVFPAIRGIQAQREYYVSMCPLRLVPKLFLFDEVELTAELRAQRQLNRGRVPEMVRYIVENPESYVFSALTASIDADVRFVPSPDMGATGLVGLLHIPMNASFIINDGQHRRAAIESALKENPELNDETIAVVFFHDRGLARCQQMFADLNRYAIRPSRSLSVLYDHRDDLAQIARAVAMRPTFDGLVEMERSALSARSLRLFTLSAINTATAALLHGQPGETDELRALAIAFWEALAAHFPDWRLAAERRIAAREIRETYLHSHGVVLHALGRTGQALIKAHPQDWGERLGPLSTINWRRAYPGWETRAMIGGRVSKSYQNVILTTNVIKQRLGLTLTSEEQRLEDAHERARDAA